jgi:hypothetical protein
MCSKCNPLVWRDVISDVDGSGWMDGWMDLSTLYKVLRLRMLMSHKRTGKFTVRVVCVTPT